MEKKKILLHCCCGPCSTSSLERIKEKFNPVLYFYNPNIEPFSEYEKRLSEIKRFSELMNVELIIGEYDNDEWFDFIKEFSKEPEGGRRCKRCFEFNLMHAAHKAKELSINFFTTTLTVSPYKNSDLIFEIGDFISGSNVKFVKENFKKKDGYKRSIELSKEYNLYRQNYCGCRFSMR